MKRKALEKYQTKTDSIPDDVPKWQVDEDMIKKIYGPA